MYFLDSIKNIYDKSPSWVKAPIGWIPLSIVLGADYRKQKNLLQQSLAWDMEQLVKYQKKLLFDMVEYAALSTPYYRRLFKDLGLPPRLQSMDQFFQIPVIDKEKVKALGDDIFSDAIPASRRYKVMTGGSSGSPSTFYMSAEAYAREWAFVHDLLARYNISPDDRKLSLRGIPFVQGKAQSFTKYNPIYRELQISPFHLTEEIVSNEVEKLLNFKPVYLHGYPSALELLAKLAKRHGWGRQLNMKGVLAISESLYPHQKLIIEDAFACDVFSFYGHTERLIFAGNSPGREGFLVDPRYGYTESIGGELIGTGFINKATPLLRYQTGDLAEIVDSDIESSGLNAMPRLEKVEGRWRQELIAGKSGAKISITALNMHSDVFLNVKRFQFYQDEVGKVELKIVPLEAYDQIRDNRAILQGFRDKVGDELDVQIKVVDSIALTERQKQLFLVQKLDLENLETS